MLLSNKKEWIIDIHNNVEDNYAEWKKPDQKEYILCDATYIKP